MSRPDPACDTCGRSRSCLRASAVRLMWSSFPPRGLYCDTCARARSEAYEVEHPLPKRRYVKGGKHGNQSVKAVAEAAAPASAAEEED